MNRFKVTLIAIISMMSICANAQDKVKGNAGVDVVSHYVWRGQDCGDAAVQPTAGVSYKGFSLSMWGSFGFVNMKDARELDLTLSYTYKGFNVGITDYWFGHCSADDNYFDYRAHNTGHVFEANVGYDFGFLSAQWFTNFAGADYNSLGKRDYSSYFEISAPFKLVTCDWKGAVGFVPYSSEYYGVGTFACTNVSLRVTKDIHVYKKWGIPVFVEGVCNPSNGKGYFVAGFTLATL